MSGDEEKPDRGKRTPARWSEQLEGNVPMQTLRIDILLLMVKHTRGLQQSCTGSGRISRHLVERVGYITHKKDGGSNVVPEAGQLQVCGHASDFRVSWRLFQPVVNRKYVVVHVQLTNIGPVSEGSTKREAILGKIVIRRTHKNDNMYNRDTKGNRCQSSLRKMRARSPGFNSSTICFSSTWKLLSKLPLWNEPAVSWVMVQTERNDWLNEWLVIWRIEVNLVLLNSQWRGAETASHGGGEMDEKTWDRIITWWWISLVTFAQAGRVCQGSP